MSKINNFNQKGSANVKSSGEEKIFDAQTAEVTHDENQWNAFQLVGATNQAERNYQSRAEFEGYNKEMRKTLDRAVAFRVGRLVALAMNKSA